MSNDYVAPFTVVVGGSAKGNDLLVETIGYSYNIKVRANPNINIRKQTSTVEQT